MRGALDARRDALAPVRSRDRMLARSNSQPDVGDHTPYYDYPRGNVCLHIAYRRSTSWTSDRRRRSSGFRIVALMVPAAAGTKRTTEPARDKSSPKSERAATMTMSRRRNARLKYASLKRRARQRLPPRKLRCRKPGAC